MPPPLPAAENHTADLIAKIFMWCLWVIFVMGCFIFSVFLPSAHESVNSYARPIGLLEASFLIVPFGLCMALRFGLLSRLRNPWVQMVFWGIGVFFSQQIMLYGIFLIREYQIVFYGLCAVAMLAYLPHWVRPNRA